MSEYQFTPLLNQLVLGINLEILSIGLPRSLDDRIAKTSLYKQL